MFKPKMIENQQDFHCQNNHGQPIHLVVLDPKLDKKQRLLCIECMENFESDAKTMGFKRVMEIIENNIEQNMKRFEDMSQQTVKQLQTCITTIQELKTSIMKLLDSLLKIAIDWNQNLLQQIQQYSQYSFFDELDKYIKKQNTNDVSNQSLINNMNRSWMTKIDNNFNSYLQDKDKFNFKDIKSLFVNISSSNFQQQGQIENQLELNQQINLSEGDINFKLIDQSVKQIDKCHAIAFDSSGSIMVSTEGYDIKVWRFINGKMELIQTLEGHSDWIQCLVYSKKQNSFISSGTDETIRCWKQLDLSNWNSSEPYQQHINAVMCIILNQNEDLLFSGSDDKSIKVWKVDFNQNTLTYMYSLDKHCNEVVALSLNQSEQFLVSCADGQNQIIIWERREQDKFQFKYFVKQSIQDLGVKVKFIKEDQFIWITGWKEINKCYVFELKEGVFQENQEKTIQLITNNQNVDEYRFPIVYNKERNLMIVRHKTYIYIIRELNDGKFKIVDKLNLETYHIQGNITDNGQYLVFWDKKKEGYSTYELLNK